MVFAKDTGAAYQLAYAIAGGAFRFTAGRWSGSAGTWDWTAPSLNAWHHHLITYDHGAGTSGHATLYLDGVSQGSGGEVLPTGTAGAETAHLMVGNDLTNANRDWGGGLQAMAFWNRVLAADEIAILSKAYDPRFVLNGLVFCAPLWGLQNPEPNRMNSGTGTLTNPHASSLRGPRLLCPAAPGRGQFATSSLALGVTLPTNFNEAIVGKRRSRRSIRIQVG